MNKVELSKQKGAVAKVIRDNSELFKDSMTKEQVVDLCHQLFDAEGLDTPWTREFFIKLGQIKSGKQALGYVYNSMLAGDGLRVIYPGQQYYECDELNESMTDNDVKEFKDKLKAGEVKFKYLKKDGSERTATGTLNPELMDLPKPKTTSDVDKASEKQKKARKLPSDSVFYYDLEAKGFRSFKMSNFIDYI